jgi:raffinose/stachyose/melibiose transport system substrate-binding protein
VSYMTTRARLSAMALTIALTSAACSAAATPVPTSTATKAPATQGPATQGPATQAPATQAPATPVPATPVPATPAPTEAAKVNLTIMWQNGSQDQLDALIAAFQAKNPNITVTPEYLAPQPEQQTMRTRLANGTMNDIFWVWPGNGNVGTVEVLAPYGYLADLSDRPWVSKIDPSIAAKEMVGGKTYAFMVEVSGWGAVYNNEAMAAAGLKIPTTYSEVLQFCKDARAKGKVAYSMGTATSYETQNIPYANWPQLVLGGNPGPTWNDQLKAGQTTFAQSGWKQVLEQTAEMATAGCHNDGFQGTDVTEALRQWSAGEALARISIGIYVRSSTTGATFTFAPMPATDVAADSWIGLAAFGGIAANAKSPNLDAAKTFIDFFASPEGDAIYVKGTSNTLTGSMPTLTDPANPPSDSFSKVYLEYQAKGQTGVYPDQDWPNPDVQQVMYTGIQNLYAGKESVQQVLDKMQAAYDKGAPAP